jgi:hypothetical protein
MDFAQCLAEMANPSKPDPAAPKKSIPNPDSPFAQTIYGAIGDGDPARGKAILTAYHFEQMATPATTQTAPQSPAQPQQPQGDIFDQMAQPQASSDSNGANGTAPPAQPTGLQNAVAALKGENDPDGPDSSWFPETGDMLSGAIKSGANVLAGVLDLI